MSYTSINPRSYILEHTDQNFNDHFDLAVMLKTCIGNYPVRI